MNNFVAVFVYGGVLNHVEFGNSVDELIDYINVVSKGFDPEDDVIQIWDKNNCVYNH